MAPPAAAKQRASVVGACRLKVCYWSRRQWESGACRQGNLELSVKCHLGEAPMHNASLPLVPDTGKHIVDSHISVHWENGKKKKKNSRGVTPLYPSLMPYSDGKGLGGI